RRSAAHPSRATGPLTGPPASLPTRGDGGDREARPSAAPTPPGTRPTTGRPAPPSTGGTGGDHGRGAGRAQLRTPAAPPAPAAVPALRAHGLTLTHPGGVTALDHVSLALAPSRITALVGPNGAGKSTLFDCLAGTLRPRRGRITLDGADITSRSAHARTRLGIARTFQRLAVFPSLTVEENVRLGEERGHVRNDPAAVERSLRLLGLAGRVRHETAAGLPTGTLRRVELARALAGQPHTLLLDEPAAGLDADETAALARILAALAADGLTVLVVEHDLDLVAGIAHTVHTMEGGRIVS
ncbi:ATP-binding cassette domain-containing protein, partial [Streptomyces sp. NPDC048266]|uniref:ABC transporter ATP-binding protein n=1 Tax=Streptomyces sp. NPDC048266 TaxID=3155787 RepID=UPI003404C6A1